MGKKNRQNSKAVEHVIPAKDKRAERRVQDILRRPHDVDEDWDDLDLTPITHRFKKSQKLE